jgi:hypothetical protein
MERRHSAVLNTEVWIDGDFLLTADGVKYSLSDMNKLTGETDSVKSAVHRLLREFKGELL